MGNGCEERLWSETGFVSTFAVSVTSCMFLRTSVMLYLSHVLAVVIVILLIYIILIHCLTPLQWFFCCRKARRSPSPSRWRKDEKKRKVEKKNNKPGPQKKTSAQVNYGFEGSKLSDSFSGSKMWPERQSSSAVGLQRPRLNLHYYPESHPDWDVTQM